MDENRRNRRWHSISNVSIFQIFFFGSFPKNETINETLFPTKNMQYVWWCFPLLLPSSLSSSCNNYGKDEKAKMKTENSLVLAILSIQIKKNPIHTPAIQTKPNINWMDFFIIIIMFLVFFFLFLMIFPLFNNTYQP